LTSTRCGLQVGRQPPGNRRYVGDPVKRQIMVGSSHVVQDAAEQVGPTGLSVAAGMVALTQQDGLETAVGSER